MTMTGSKGRASELELAYPCCPPRRRVLAGLAAIGASALAPSLPSLAQTSPAKPRRIDFHHHFTPPAFAEVRDRSSGGGDRTWSVENMLEDMEKGGITTAMHSTAGTELGAGDKARRLARAANEFAAKLSADHPGRFGSFATLPMPDIEGSLAEIGYALDTLKADGIYLWTNYDGKYLGDPAFTPIYEELNRRKALIFVHPVSAPCCRNVIPGMPLSAIEYGTDTTRAIARMIFTGNTRRYPDMKVIWSHAGGTMPFLIERFLLLTKEKYQKELPDGFAAEARKFYYDTAQVTHRIPMLGLKTLVPISQIVFGSDFPYRNSAEHVEGLRSAAVYDPAELQAIDWQNAVRLLPRWA
jgi:predicted TIM-barrel fold metal-dependent hydrolase